MTQGFQEAEASFLKETLQSFDQTHKLERAGSCALSALFVNDDCYIANVGDSRAILSSNEGRLVTALSQDHRPNDPQEYQRVFEAGGSVYRYSKNMRRNV